jgi:hypothetical protein
MITGRRIRIEVDGQQVEGEFVHLRPNDLEVRHPTRSMTSVDTFASRLVDHLHDGDWRHLDSGNGCVQRDVLRVTLPWTDGPSGWGATVTVAVEDEDRLVVQIELDHAVPDEHHGRAAVLIAHLNWHDCPLGHYEMDADNGSIRYRLTHHLAFTRLEPSDMWLVSIGVLETAREVVDDTLPMLLTGLGVIEASI